MNIENEKRTIRSKVEALRSSLTAQQRLEKQAILNHKLIQFCTQGQLQSVMVYMPYRSEPDVTPFIEWCWESDLTVYCPRMVPASKSLTIHPVRSYHDTQVNQFGIKEPRSPLAISRNIEHIQMILVPGLAFDKQLARLGYGGGYYDRLLADDDKREYSSPWKIAVAFDVQIVDRIPSQPHDVQMDLLMTESMTMYAKQS